MTEVRQELYRLESIESRHAAWLGRQTLALGLPARLLSLASIFLVLAAIALLIRGTYTRRVELHGVLLPSTGLIQVTSPSSGRVVSLAARDGAAIASGAPLYVVNLETSTASGDTQKEILRALADQRATMVEQITLKVKLRNQQEALLGNQIDNYGEQIRQLGVQQDQKTAFVQKLEKDLGDYNRYVRTGVGNLNERNIQQSNWMRAKDELEELRSATLRLQSQVLQAQYERGTFNLRINAEINEIRAKIAELDQQVATSESRRSIEVRAPGAGTVTAIATYPGQIVATGARMLTILPTGQTLRAELLAPSTSIAFIRPGQRVRLRYTAFPYQKFGQYWGTVTEVSGAAIQHDELKSLVPSLSPADEAKTFYRVAVTPDHQDVSAYGHPQPLQASMQVEAHVLLEGRTLYQWVLEPLYGLYGPKTT